MNTSEDAVAAASSAMSVLERVSGEGGALARIAAGKWVGDLASPEQRADAVAIMDALSEQAAQARRSLDGLRHPLASPAIEIAATAASARLPFNRKERYFTGTVLPMIVAADGFAHLDRFLALCGLSARIEPGLEGFQDLQLFTEYSFAESIFTAADKGRFADRPLAADTPDLVLCGPDWLLAVEAKMYDQPSRVDLNRQLAGQALLVKYWAELFSIPGDRVRHVALLPRALAARLGELDAPTVTWESVADAYRHVGPRYWMGVLEHANTADLASDPVMAFKANAHGVRTGTQIAADDLEDAETGERFQSMGRAQGLDGGLLAKDIATGGWKDQSYEVRREGEPNANWFPIEAFLDRLRAAGEL